MKEILFRGKSKRDSDSGEWVYGYLVPYFDIREYEDGYGDYFGKAITPGHLSCMEVEVDPKSIGQYIGMKDEDGVKIFEGDVVAYRHKDWIENEVGQVLYMEEGEYPAFDLYGHTSDCNMLSMLKSSGDYRYKVIGNLYDDDENGLVWKLGEAFNEDEE